MQILESAMAFAVVMIILSTITSGIVELLLRLSGTRERNLERTIRALFDSVIWPRLEMTLVGADGKTERKVLARRFVDSMIGNPVTTTADRSEQRPRSFPTRMEGKVDKLSILAFAERLGRTDVGRAILAQGQDQLELLVRDFVRSFDRFGRASSEVFRKKAQQTAMIVGVVFALAANVDAGRVFTTLMNNPELRVSLIEHVEEANAANEEAMATLDKLSQELEKGALAGEQSIQIKANIDDLNRRMKALEATGLPIGPAYYPYCRGGDAGDVDCTASGNSLEAFLKILRWVVLSALAGVLIGLGGPFWFRVFSGLSQVFQVLRTVGAGRTGKGDTAGTAAVDVERETMPAPVKSAMPKDAVDAFRVAVQVHTHATVPRWRAVLKPDGQPL